MFLFHHIIFFFSHQSLASPPFFFEDLEYTLQYSIVSYFLTTPFPFSFMPISIGPIPVEKARLVFGPLLGSENSRLSMS